MTLKKLWRARKARRHYETQISALEAEREDLRAALRVEANQHGTVGVWDYEWHVQLAAKGLAQRDKHPMPPSVTTPEEFYEVMAGAALDAMCLRDLLKRVARAEPSPAHTPGTANNRVMGGEVPQPEPRAVEPCGLVSSVMRTTSLTGRWV